MSMVKSAEKQVIMMGMINGLSRDRRPKDSLTYDEEERRRNFEKNLNALTDNLGLQSDDEAAPELIIDPPPADFAMSDN